MPKENEQFTVKKKNLKTCKETKYYDWENQQKRKIVKTKHILEIGQQEH